MFFLGQSTEFGQLKKKEEKTKDEKRAHTITITGIFLKENFKVFKNKWTTMMTKMFTMWESE